MTCSLLKPTLDLWPEALALWKDFQASPHQWKIEGSQDTFEAYYQAALVDPAVFMRLGFKDGDIAGFAIATVEPKMVVAGKSFQKVNQFFVRAVYVPLHASEVTALFHEEVMREARKFQCRWVSGYCRPDLPVKEVEKAWGCAPAARVWSYIVMETEVTDG